MSFYIFSCFAYIIDILWDIKPSSSGILVSATIEMSSGAHVGRGSFLGTDGYPDAVSVFFKQQAHSDFLD